MTYRRKIYGQRENEKAILRIKRATHGVKLIENKSGQKLMDFLG